MSFEGGIGGVRGAVEAEGEVEGNESEVGEKRLCEEDEEGSAD